MKKFIVLEGCDGAGKSSCAQALAVSIGGLYYKTPPSPFSNLRASVEAVKDYRLRFYYYLAGTLYASQEIKKILQTSHVVCDRYIFTTIAYHRVLGVDIPAGLEEIVTPPDYCFCLYAEKEELRKRIRARQNISVFDDAFDFQGQVLQEFKKFPLELFNTSQYSVADSVQVMLKKIRLD